MSSNALENLRVYQMAERLADEIWNLVMEWEPFSRNALGSQLVRAADSVGANIAEGFGRGSFADNKRFVRIARGSLYEVRHFLRRAYARNLINPEATESLKTLIAQLPKSLNAYLGSIGKTGPCSSVSND